VPIVLLALAVLALTGCASSASERPARTRSWRATTIMAGTAWLDGVVPGVYARRALGTANAALARDDPDGAARASRLRAAIERGDRAEVARLLER
jgi:hypothetical protein